MRTVEILLLIVRVSFLFFSCGVVEFDPGKSEFDLHLGETSTPCFLQFFRGHLGERGVVIGVCANGG